MLKLFFYIGDNSLPYRTIMAKHSDFTANELLIHKSSVVIAEQTHSNNVHLCMETDSGAGFDQHPQINDCDALISNLPNQFLLIRTADCTPVLLYDSQKHAVGAIHSGREGTRKNIVCATINKMISEFSSQTEHIMAWIGPGICKKHYQVSREIGSEFHISCQKDGLDIKTFDITYPDIQDVIFKQLLSAGIERDNILSNKTCTYESLDHFSFRRDGTHNRQVNLIGMYNGKYYL